MRILKGDTVKVLYGKEAGKTGVVLSVDSKKGELLVDGVNLVTRHVKGDKKGKAGGIVKVLRPVTISKVQLFDVETGKATRVKYEVVDGVKTRVAVKSGKAIASVKPAPKKAKAKVVKKADKDSKSEK